jgi:hypothetical protein
MVFLLLLAALLLQALLLLLGCHKFTTVAGVTTDAGIFAIGGVLLAQKNKHTQLSYLFCKADHFFCYGFIECQTGKLEKLSGYRIGASNYRTI